MLYNSTENNKEVVSAAQAIAQGISKDGGLFVPQELPKYTEETFKSGIFKQGSGVGSGKAEGGRGCSHREDREY